jgi:hypothetical protein
VAPTITVRHARIAGLVSRAVARHSSAPTWTRRERALDRHRRGAERDRWSRRHKGAPHHLKESDVLHDPHGKDDHRDEIASCDILEEATLKTSLGESDADPSNGIGGNTSDDQIPFGNRTRVI